MGYNVCKNLDRDNMEELLHNTIIAMYEIEDSKLNKILDDDVMMYYFYGALNNKRKDYYKDLNKNEIFIFIDEMMAPEDIFKEVEDEVDFEVRLAQENMDETIYKKAKQLLSDRSNWFDNRIFLDMVENKYTSFREFGKATGICYSTIYFAYKRAETKLKNKLYGKEK